MINDFLGWPRIFKTADEIKKEKETRKKLFLAGGALAVTGLAYSTYKRGKK